ncbi:hypothetical protein ACFX12_000363 [Malus domestica]
MAVEARHLNLFPYICWKPPFMLTLNSRHSLPPSNSFQNVPREENSIPFFFIPDSTVNQLQKLRPFLFSRRGHLSARAAATVQRRPSHFPTHGECEIGSRGEEEAVGAVDNGGD